MAIQNRNLGAWVATSGARAWKSSLRVGRVLGKSVLLLGAIAACGWGGHYGLRHLVASPRFQLRTIDFTPTTHLGSGDVLALSGVALGDPLLAVDTDGVAERIAAHPWVSSARVSRRLPSALVIEVSERQAVAVAALSGLYLVDENGRPFKRASMEEADGLPVLTGIERGRYADMREVSEAAFREAVAVWREYRSKPGRPTVGEVSIDPGFGFSLLLLEGGAEIRLGRGNYGKKLAQFDRILEAVQANGMGSPSALKIVHLDLPESGRIPVQLRASPESSVVAKNASTKLAKN